MGEEVDDGVAAVTVETEVADIDGDGLADVVTEVTTVVADVER